MTLKTQAGSLVAVKQQNTPYYICDAGRNARRVKLGAFWALGPVLYGLACSSENEPGMAHAPQAAGTESSEASSLAALTNSPPTATQGAVHTSDSSSLASASSNSAPSASTRDVGGTGGAGGTSTSSSGGASAGAPAAGGQGGTPEPIPSAPLPNVELPADGRQLGHVVNLISPAGVSEVESLLRGENDVGLPASASLFLQHYLDDYDFLIVLLDHEVPNAVAAAAFEPVYRPAQRATGHVSPVDRRLTHGSERLLGVIGGTALVTPPLEHELAHYWAMHLDAQFGFGRDRDQNFLSHWGMTSVNGQLGGFDESTLFCARPEGAQPPECLAEESGRYSFRVAPFFPYVNRDVNYAPLELYLMGLLPAAEVPPRYWLLEDASYYDAVTDETTGELAIDSSGVTEILFSDILEVHGEVPLRPETQRSFSAAFMVVSAAPVSDEVLTRVAGWQEVFGNYAASTGLLQSFEQRTGGRAQLSTRLGRLRTADDPIPNPPAPQLCSVTLQDCGEGLGCYGSMDRECSIPGDNAPGEACDTPTDCSKGYTCPNSYKLCAEFCDALDDSAEKACNTLCPGDYNHLVDDADNVLAGYCLPE